jgi:predicted metal-dependent phosphoesterase TrpH
MTAQILTQDYLHTLFDYKDGELYWKVRLANCIQIGDKAGCLDANGYYRIRINKRLYGVHRLIFAMHHGYFPRQIDHIDRNTKNNKIKNLREANSAQNMWNTLKNHRNTSGYKNVIFRKDKQVWACRFKVNGKNIMRGYCKTAEEANELAIQLRKELHGRFST